MSFPRFPRCLPLAFVALAAPFAGAQAPDLTRPPAAILSPPPRPAPAAASAAAELPEPVPASRIIVTGAARRFVVVEGGHTVYVGDTYQGARLMEVRSDGAVWVRNGVREIDYGGGRIAKLPPDSAGTGARKPTTSNKQNNATSGGSPR